MTLSYFSFFGYVKIWIFFLSKNTHINTQIAKLAVLRKEVPSVFKEVEKRPKENNWWWYIFLPDGFEFIAFGLLAIFGVAWLIDAGGSVLLLDVALDIALAGGLVTVTKSVNNGDCHVNVLKKTILIFLITLSFSSVGLYTLNESCPGHAKISEMATACWKRQ
jgi:hypothetical protein